MILASAIALHRRCTLPSVSSVQCGPDCFNCSNQRKAWCVEQYYGIMVSDHGSCFLKSADILFHVLCCAGLPANPPVVLIHGFGASAYHWRYVIPELAKSYYVHAVDLLGFGLSDKAHEDYNGFNIWAEQLHDYVNQVLHHLMPFAVSNAQSLFPTKEGRFALSFGRLTGNRHWKSSCSENIDRWALLSRLRRNHLLSQQLGLLLQQLDSEVWRQSYRIYWSLLQKNLIISLDFKPTHHQRRDLCGQSRVGAAITAIDKFTHHIALYVHT